MKISFSFSIKYLKQIIYEGNDNNYPLFTGKFLSTLLRGFSKRTIIILNDIETTASLIRIAVYC
jgi:hypothetical protein